MSFIEKLPVIGPIVRGVKEGYQGSPTQNSPSTQNNNTDNVAKQRDLAILESYSSKLQQALNGSQIKDNFLASQVKGTLQDVSIFQIGAQNGQMSLRELDSEVQEVEKMMQKVGLQQASNEQTTQQQTTQQNSNGGNGGGSNPVDTLIHGVGTVLEGIGKIGGTLLKGIADLF